jgi:hypothetical protein
VDLDDLDIDNLGFKLPSGFEEKLTPTGIPDHQWVVLQRGGGFVEGIFNFRVRYIDEEPRSVAGELILTLTARDRSDPGRFVSFRASVKVILRCKGGK